MGLETWTHKASIFARRLRSGAHTHRKTNGLAEKMPILEYHLCGIGIRKPPFFHRTLRGTVLRRAFFPVTSRRFSCTLGGSGLVSIHFGFASRGLMEPKNRVLSVTHGRTETAPSRPSFPPPKNARTNGDSLQKEVIFLKPNLTSDHLVSHCPNPPPGGDPNLIKLGPA